MWWIYKNPNCNCNLENARYLDMPWVFKVKTWIYCLPIQYLGRQIHWYAGAFKIFKFDLWYHGAGSLAQTKSKHI